MSTFETLTTTLQTAGLRLTPQRRMICRLLSESDQHPTARMLYDEVRQEYPSLSLMTVYNTLNTLADLGAVHAIGPTDDDSLHYDANLEPHVNMVCTGCHRIVDLPSQQVARLTDEVRDHSGYHLEGGRVLYYGLCPACQSRR